MIFLTLLLMADITLDNGLALHYKDEGAGEPILLITGMGVRLNTWDAVADLLEDDYRVIRLDNRGIGGSGDLEGPYSIDIMAQDAAGLMAKLGIDSYHVAGISLGSFAAQSLALQFPERVKTLTLIGSSPGGPVHVAPDAEVLGFFQTMFTMTPEQRTDQGLKLSLHPDWMAANPETVAAMRQQSINYTPPPTAVTRQIMAALAFDHSERAKQITVPTLVIHGEADRIVPPANGKNLAALIPNATHQVIKGSGHLTIIDAAKAVVEAIQNLPKK